MSKRNSVAWCVVDLKYFWVPHCGKQDNDAHLSTNPSHLLAVWATSEQPFPDFVNAPPKLGIAIEQVEKWLDGKVFLG